MSQNLIYIYKILEVIKKVIKSFIKKQSKTTRISVTVQKYKKININAKRQQENYYNFPKVAAKLF